jgi:hypothetical protein
LGIIGKQIVKLKMEITNAGISLSFGGDEPAERMTGSPTASQTAPQALLCLRTPRRTRSAFLHWKRNWSPRVAG